MEKKIIRVFTTPACPYCFTLKEFLKDNGYDFEEVDIASNESARNEVQEKTGQMGAPVVDINGEFVVGFDREKITKFLGIK